jgi:hypothetical protein
VHLRRDQHLPHEVVQAAVGEPLHDALRRHEPLAVVLVHKLRLQIIIVIMVVVVVIRSRSL